MVAHTLERPRQGDDCMFEASLVSTVSSSKSELFRGTPSGFKEEEEKKVKKQVNLVDRDFREERASSDV